jgi:hypothetical protein
VSEKNGHFGGMPKGVMLLSFKVTSIKGKSANEVGSSLYGWTFGGRLKE